MGSYGLPALAQGQRVQETARILYMNIALPDLPYGSCTFRADPMHKGDKVVPPASFPPAPPSDPNMIPDELPMISDEVLEEVSRNPIPGRS
jgi:hypothetical protein